MVVLYQKKIIFVHIPKTGGSAIERLLTDNDRYPLDFIGVRNNRSTHHYMAFELLHILGTKRYKNFYKFAFVRNPYDRIVSEYYYCKKQGIGFKGGQSFDDFLTYVEQVIKRKLYFTNIYLDHFIPQYHFVYFKGKKMVNDIFKYENFDEVIPVLRKMLKINAELQVINKTTNKQELVLTDEQKEKIYNIYKPDFMVFGYEK